MLRRIGELRAAAISEHALVAAAIEKIKRYENRVLSRRRKARGELDRLLQQTGGDHKYCQNEPTVKKRQTKPNQNSGTATRLTISTTNSVTSA